MTDRRKHTRRAYDRAVSGTAFKDLRSIITAWEDISVDDEVLDALGYEHLSRQAIAFGDPTLAFDILQKGKAQFPKNPRLGYLSALALVKAGSYGEAARGLKIWLSTATPRHPLYVDLKSLEGRIAKDLWARLPAGRDKDVQGNNSARAYEAAYKASGGYFPGINAASMHMLTGDLERGCGLAREVQRRCLKEHAKAGSADHWLLATLGEAALLLGDSDDATQWYARAARTARKRVGDVASMRRQLKLLKAHFDTAPQEQALALPKVAVFAGHMVDRPGRPEPRFPESLVRDVTKLITKTLADEEIGFGYCSAACGADVLFIEEMQKRGAEVHVTLPFHRDDFLQTSVAFAGERWVRRFDDAMRRATTVSYAIGERYLGDDALFAYTSSLTQGAALLRAQQLESEAMLLAVVDESQPGQTGGTMGSIVTWGRQPRRLHKIDLAEVRRKTRTQGRAAAPKPAAAVPAPSRHATSHPRQIKSMLFADMVGFSKLDDETTPAFLVNFLGEIARVIAGCDVAPAFLNTWGDGLFLVFDEAGAAADFALRLRDAVRKVDWVARGLPRDTNIRIGLHTGPVLPALDPIIGRNNFFGSHVNRAARIEPVTAPGAVYISEQMASLLAADGATAFACDYLGSLPLAKHFGSSVLYRLRRATEVE